MSIIHPGLFLVFKRFPDRREMLQRLYSASESFQSLCESYQQCSQAVNYWGKSDDRNAPDRHREYCTLLDELEQDILQFSSEERDVGSGKNQR